MIRTSIPRRGVGLATIGLLLPVALVGLTATAHAVPQQKTNPTLTEMPATNLNNAHTGDSVSDLATVGGIGGVAPTGTVTFVLYSGSLCGTSIENGPAVAVTAGTGSSTASYQFTTALQAANSPYSVQATYSGDTNYNGKVGHCDVVTVNLANPTVGTVPSAVTPTPA